MRKGQSSNYEMPIGIVRQAVLSIVAQNMPDWHLYIVGVEGDESTKDLTDEVTVDERVSIVLARSHRSTSNATWASSGPSMMG